MENERLLQLEQANTGAVDRSVLVDLQDVDIDPSKSIGERFDSFLCAIQNPYCFLVDGVVVQVEFSQSDRTLEEALKTYLETP